MLQNPSLWMMRGALEGSSEPPVTDANTVQSVIEKFREKYGAKHVKKYYSKFDVVVVVQLN